MEPMSDKTVGRSGSMARAGGAVDDFIGDVRDQALGVKRQYIDEGWNKTREFVRENPGKTVLLAAGVGMLLGAILVRRR